MKKFMIFIAVLFITLCIGGYGIYQILFGRSVITTKIEKNLSFINSNIPILYFSKGELHKTDINGENNIVLGKYLTAYSFNDDFNKIVFVEHFEETKTVLSIIDLTTNTIILKKEIPEFIAGAPTFSPDNTKVIYKTTISNVDYLHILDIKNNIDKVVFKTSIRDCLKARWCNNSKDIWISLHTIPDNNAKGFNVFYKIENAFSDNKLDNKITLKEFDVNNIKDLHSLPSIVQVGNNRLKDELPFVNKENKLIFTKENKKLVSYKPKTQNPYAGKRISDYVYTPDYKYLAFVFESNLYIVDVETGKIGLLSKNARNPSFTGKDCVVIQKQKISSNTLGDF